MSHSSHDHGKDPDVTIHRTGGGCPGVLQHLSDYLEKDMEPQLLDEIETHLNECDDCRHCLDEIRGTIEFIHSNTHSPIPDEQKAGIRDRLWTALQDLSTEL